MSFINSPIFRSSIISLAQGLLAGLVVTSLIFLLTAVFSKPIQADELSLIKKSDDVKQGQLLFKSNNELLLAPLLKTDVDFTITGMIARVSVKQHFQNTSSEWQEGVYVFPLPHDAAVDHLRMYIGERVIEGQIKERKQAKQLYQKATREGKKASLIEQERPNIFTNSVANIAPGESITIEIEYQQTAQYDQGEFRLRFPMVVAPRYIPGHINAEQTIDGFTGTGWALNTNEVKDAASITPPVLDPTKQDKENKTINPVSINIDLNAGFELNQIYSPYHSIIIDEIKDEKVNKKLKYQIQLSDQQTPANRDFELVWQPQSQGQISAALFTETKGHEEYALLMMLPNIEQDKTALQREIIFVIDTSGSMAGESIKQAKSALTLALSRLKSGDRFNIIQFNSVTDMLFQFPQAHSKQTIQQAKNYIHRLNADGGTEMKTAMQAALKQYGDSYDVRQVIFMTDGSIGNEDALFRVIEQNIKNSRLFQVGIGSAPNSHFMNRAARFGRGTFTFIGKTSEVQEKMAKLFARIESPVLTNIQIDWSEQSSGDQTIETWPQTIPDVYTGEPLLISIKADAIPESVRVTGKTSEQDWQMNLQLQGGQDQNGISTLWARRKIAALMDQRTNSNERTTIEKQITELALSHHLVSKFTSLVAVDVTPTRVKEAILKSRAIPTNLPASWKYEKVFGAMPQTATPALLHFLIGLFLTLITFPLMRLTRNHV